MSSGSQRPPVYYLQNDAIHQARAELGAKGVLDPAVSLEQIRDMAAELNSGMRSISSLNLEQRSRLIDWLIDLGATVRKPHIYISDYDAEAAAAKMKDRKVIRAFGPKESQLRLIDALAAEIDWKSTDGYTNLCKKLIGAPRPRNSKEVTKIHVVLKSIRSRQPAPADPKPINPYAPVSNGV